MRGLDERFLNAMRVKLEHGRQQGYVGWDQHWEDCIFSEDPKGPSGLFVSRLVSEMCELIIALREGDSDQILHEAADVANFAMFIADIHKQ